MPALIEFDNVHKTFGAEASEVTALHQVSFSIESGEVFGIIGRSGAGKSTLLRVINQLERPTRGRVIVAGQDLTALSDASLRRARQSMGMIFQHFNLLSCKTVAQNVAYPLEIAGVRSRGEIAQRVSSLLDRVGLTEQAARYPAQLSGGQKQRVGIARALACGPKVLLCDEATSALDPETTQSILRLLAELNRELGLTVVLITHEMDVVRRVCDRVAVLAGGRVVEMGAVADVFLHPKHAETLRLVREAEHIDEQEERSDFAHVPGRLIRLTFRGDSTYSPLLGTVARETGVDYAILSGRIDRIKDTPYGQLTLALTGGNEAAALNRFKAAGLIVEELRR